MAKRNPQNTILNTTIKIEAVDVEAEVGAGVGAEVGAEARVGEMFDQDWT